MDQIAIENFSTAPPGQGDLLVRAVRGAPAAWGVEERGGGGWERQQQRATAARPLGIAAARLRVACHGTPVHGNNLPLPDGYK
jgi:hypothetical protein